MLFQKRNHIIMQCFIMLMAIIPYSSILYAQKALIKKSIKL